MAPGPIKGPSACRPALAPPFPPAPPAPHGPIPSAPMAPMAHGSWPHGQQWLHGPIFSTSRAPVHPHPWPHGPSPMPHGPLWPYASRPDQMTLSNDFKGPQCMPARSARSACSALPPLHPPSMALDPHGPQPMPPWSHGSWRHGPQYLHASALTANPLLCGSCPQGAMPWPYASRPNQMTLKGPSACPPAPPALLAPPSMALELHGPHGPRPPWPAWTYASLAPWLLAPWPPMSPCFGFHGQPPTPNQMTLKGPSACPPAPPALFAPPSIPWPSNCMAPGPMPPWPHGLDPHGLHGPMPPGAMAPNVSMLRRPTPPGPMACPGPMPLDPIK